MLVNGWHISLPCGCPVCCMATDHCLLWGWSPHVLLHDQVLVGPKHCAMSAVSTGQCSRSLCCTSSPSHLCLALVCC